MSKDKKMIEDSNHKETSFLEMTHFCDPSLPNIFDIPSCNFGADAETNKDEIVKAMAKILCPKGTANCEKCSKNYKCNVSFSQLSQLFDGGCRIIGDDEVVISKRQYEQLKKYNRDRKRLRLKWQQAKQDLDDIYSNGFVLLVEHHEIVDQVARETRQETAREILQKIPHLGGTANAISNGIIISTDYTINRAKLVELAEHYGIELEEVE